MINSELKPICEVCKNHKKKAELIPLELIDIQLLEFIKNKFPECPVDGYICKVGLKNIRMQYVEKGKRRADQFRK